MEPLKNEVKAFNADSWLGKDLLGRTGFAERLAERIKPLATEQSLVIGIFGPWGSGKTIVKEMTLDLLKKQDENTRPLVLEFNAWEWSGHEEMTKALFKQIRLTLRKKDRGKISQSIAKKLKFYESYLTTVTVSLDGVSKTAQTSLLAFVSLAAFAFSDKFTTGLSKGVGYLVGGIAALIPILKFGNEFVKTLRETFSADAEMRDKTLPEVKEELSELLAKLEKPLLITIDDVDRLSADEIKTLFQLVKQNLNFPRIIYLLLMDKAYVEKALEETFKVTSGKEYLRKIIHVGFDLPQIERRTLDGILREKLMQVYDRHNIKFDARRLLRLSSGSLSDLFKNLRDLNRFSDAMDFQLTLFKRGEVLEVDPIDLAIVETLRQQEEALYRKIQMYKPEFIGEIETLQAGADDPFENAIKSLVGLASDDNKKFTEELLLEIFPHPVTHSLVHRREFRICSPAAFDKYFLFNVPTGHMSNEEVSRMLSLIGNIEQLEGFLTQYHKQKRLLSALGYLEACLDKIETEKLQPLLITLCNIGDLLETEQRGFPVTSVSFEVLYRIASNLLKREPDDNRRVTLLLNAIQTSSGIFLPLKLVAVESVRRKENPELCIMPEVAAEELRQASLVKIEYWSKTDKFNKHPRLYELLICWEKLDSAKPVEWVHGLLKTGDGVIDFLNTYLAAISPGLGVQQFLLNAAGAMEAYIPIDELSDKVREFDLKSQNPELIAKYDRAALALYNFKKEQSQNTESEA